MISTGTELAYNLAAHGSKLLLVFSLSGREKMLQTLSNGTLFSKPNLTKIK